MPRRLVQLYVGLVLYGVSMALFVRADLGLDPWDVFHQGLSDLTGLSFGLVVILVGAIVLLAWIPLRQRPGLGTISNVFVIGLVVDPALAVIPQREELVVRVPMLIAAILGIGLAASLYIGARLGPGPRDGLMTGFHARTGRSIRLVRTVLELAVLAVGFLLGGTVGIGTVAFALTIGPIVGWLLPRVTAGSGPLATSTARVGSVSPPTEALATP